MTATPQTPASGVTPLAPDAGLNQQNGVRENQGCRPGGTVPGPAPSAADPTALLTPGTPSPTLSSPVLGVGDGTQGETVECVYCEFTVTAPTAIEGYQRMTSHYDVAHRFAVPDRRWVG